MTHKLNTTDPKSIVNFININYPQYNGMCYYDIETKTLKSNSQDVVFYFDPIHGILEIKENGNN